MAGREFIEKLSGQDVNVHKLSGAALDNLVVTGEVPMSPTIFDSNIFVAKRKGAAVEWRPLDPVVANVGYSGLVAKAPPPACGVALSRLHPFQRRPAIHRQRRPQLAARRRGVAG